VLENLRLWLDKTRGGGSIAAAQSFAETAGGHVRTVQPEEGWLIESASHDPLAPWRIEWGASHRKFMGPVELRYRGPVPQAPPDAAWVIMSHSLMDRVEATLFQQFTASVQTNLHEETPPEMRWLAIFSMVRSSELGALKGGYRACGSEEGWWAHTMSTRLERALLRRDDDIPPAVPLPDLCMTLRQQRLTLRVAAPRIDTALINLHFDVFAAALRQLRGEPDTRPGDLPV